jgi:hypothetical protein
MKTNKYLILITFYIIHSAFYIVAEATVRYVSKTGSSTPPYTSWSTAADSIQKCINICEDGDTIYVANGVYKEYLRINKEITLIGSSMDSTIIDGTGLSDTTILINSITSIKYFKIIGNGYANVTSRFVIIAKKKFYIENCTIRNSKFGILARGGDTYYIKDNFFNQLILPLYLSASQVNANYYIDGNLILMGAEYDGSGILIDFNGYYFLFKNLIIAEPYNTTIGIDIVWPQKFYIFNNLISGFKKNIYVDIVYDTSYIINNILSHSLYDGLVTYASSRTRVINSIIKNSRENGFFATQNLKADYNLLYQNGRDFYRGSVQGDSNITGRDPMLVNDIKPTLTNNWDYHLQAYSPAIDKGDPTLLDRDGSRSDIGMYGGPFGEIYTYQDLAPRPPRNLTAVVDSGRVMLRWKKNTEADTSHYNIYRSTTSNFTIDSTKLIGSTKDTSFINTYLPIYERLYYKITCVDRQGNQSQPSEEIMINLTSISEYPTVVNDYYLYQNYPNPFNPTTKIGYKLKDRGYVKLMVYDIKGEQIAVLVNQEQEAGYYEVEFGVGNGLLSVPDTGIASGIYIYRIEVIGEGNIPVYTEMRKMVLVK